VGSACERLAVVVACRRGSAACSCRIKAYSVAHRSEPSYEREPSFGSPGSPGSVLSSFAPLERNRRQLEGSCAVGEEPSPHLLRMGRRSRQWLQSSLTRLETLTPIRYQENRTKPRQSQQGCAASLSTKSAQFRTRVPDLPSLRDFPAIQLARPRAVPCTAFRVEGELATKLVDRSCSPARLQRPSQRVDPRFLTRFSKPEFVTPEGFAIPTPGSPDIQTSKDFLPAAKSAWVTASATKVNRLIAVSRLYNKRNRRAGAFMSPPIRSISRPCSS